MIQTLSKIKARETQLNGENLGNLEKRLGFTVSYKRSCHRTPKGSAGLGSISG